MIRIVTGVGETHEFEISELQELSLLGYACSLQRNNVHKRIITLVCHYYKISEDLLMDKEHSRRTVYTRAKTIIAKRLTEVYNYTLQDVAVILRLKSHATILYHLNKFEFDKSLVLGYDKIFTK